MRDRSTRDAPPDDNNQMIVVESEQCALGAEGSNRMSGNKSSSSRRSVFMVAQELATLFGRDINKVIEQVRAFPEDRLLWETRPGMSNSAGNLALHLIGNLSEYIGRQLGGMAFTRQRSKEFSEKGVSITELIARLEQVAELTHRIVAALAEATLSARYPEAVLGYEMTTVYFLIHLLGHLNYHLGQMDYLRRMLTGDGPIQYPNRLIPSNAAVL